MSNLKRYINQVLGITISIIPLKKQSLQKLVVYLTYEYDIQETVIYGQRVCLLVLKEGAEILSPERLYKQMLFVTERIEIPVIYVFNENEIASYNLERMRSRGINFIIQNKEIFTPILTICVQKSPKALPREVKLFTPLAQFLLLYHLQKETLSGSTTQQLSDKFEHPYRTVYDAVKVLQKLGFCNFIGSKEKRLQFVAGGKELWEKAQDFFQNPVERTLFTDQTPNEKQICISGDNALSHHTWLNDQIRRTYAVWKNEVKNLTIETNPYSGESTIEVWRYDPKPLSIDGFIDKLSLYLLFKNDDDPRVQIELERRIINEMQWLEE